ncbi:uncharacterized protein LOC143440017 [Arvicanthis niloticus]|uniref:uncharacterized protein LOC143310873 n=1 Tax=Arvicanthis niloticus TaxID=61156 RepID=UPI00402BD143
MLGKVQSPVAVFGTQHISRTEYGLHCDPRWEAAKSYFTPSMDSTHTILWFIVEERLINHLHLNAQVNCTRLLRRSSEMPDQAASHLLCGGRKASMQSSTRCLEASLLPAAFG